PQDVLKSEIERFREIGVNIHTGAKVSKDKFDEIYRAHDAVVVACGAHRPRKLNVPGAEDMATAYDFLRNINTGNPPDLKGRRVVIIGAGNVGMDVAAEAFHCGAREVTAVDVQKPAAFGKELEIAGRVPGDKDSVAEVYGKIRKGRGAGLLYGRDLA
ncbi:MAG: FAD-dependent oxidoreductase, partial [Nitrospirae bacterium]|nr:FAD-dependent oxidoreductase [Nitrospirota bacterium]